MKNAGKMKGKVLSVNISDRKGEKKRRIECGRLIKNLGMDKDAHAGMPNRQLSLLAEESIRKIREKGIDVTFGDFAENITTEGIILHLLPLGTELQVGDRVRLRVTQIGKECHDRCAIFAQVGDCVMPREGIFAEVLVEGEVRAGDEIEIIENQ